MPAHKKISTLPLPTAHPPGSIFLWQPEWKSSEVIEMNVQIDHVHIVVSIPPKVSVSVLMGTLKGKLAIKLFKSYPRLKQKPYWGNHFWSRGYFVNTVGIDEDMIRRYVKYQEGEDKKEETQSQNFDMFGSQEH